MKSEEGEDSKTPAEATVVGMPGFLHDGTGQTWVFSLSSQFHFHLGLYMVVRVSEGWNHVLLASSCPPHSWHMQLSAGLCPVTHEPHLTHGKVTSLEPSEKAAPLSCRLFSGRTGSVGRTVYARHHTHNDKVRPYPLSRPMFLCLSMSFLFLYINSLIESP